MGFIQNTATKYCETKQYMTLFIIFVVLIGTVYLLKKKPVSGNKKNNTPIIGISGLLVISLVVYYHVLKTPAGCNLSIIGNVATRLKK
jgi:hypothetical protein